MSFAALGKKFFRDIKRIFSGRNLIWHALVIVLTYCIVVFGVDRWIIQTFHGNGVKVFGFGAGMIGFVLPIAAPLIFFAVGALRKSTVLIRNGWLLAEAEIIALLTSFFYKAFTGRPGPSELFGVTPVDTSHVFKFGFLRGGVFWGWPSSHTCVAFAVSITLFLLYRSRPLRVAVIFWAFLVGFGASVGFHWLSDAIAGGIIGTVVGVVAARAKK